MIRPSSLFRQSIAAVLLTSFLGSMTPVYAAPNKSFFSRQQENQFWRRLREFRGSMGDFYDLLIRNKHILGPVFSAAPVLFLLIMGYRHRDDISFGTERFKDMFISWVEAMTTTSNAWHKVARDFQKYLEDGGDVPESVIRFTRLIQNEDMQEGVKAWMKTVLTVLQEESTKRAGEGQGRQPLVDKLLDRIFNPGSSDFILPLSQVLIREGLPMYLEHLAAVKAQQGIPEHQPNQQAELLSMIFNIASSSPENKVILQEIISTGLETYIRTKANTQERSSPEASAAEKEALIAQLLSFFADHEAFAHDLIVTALTTHLQVGATLPDQQGHNPQEEEGIPTTRVNPPQEGLYKTLIQQMVNYPSLAAAISGGAVKGFLEGIAPSVGQVAYGIGGYTMDSARKAGRWTKNNLWIGGGETSTSTSNLIPPLKIPPHDENIDETPLITPHREEEESDDDSDQKFYDWDEEIQVEEGQE